MTRRKFNILSCFGILPISTIAAQNIPAKEIFHGINWRDIKCYYWDKVLNSRQEQFVETEREFFSFIKDNPSFSIVVKNRALNFPENRLTNLSSRVSMTTSFLFNNYLEKFGSSSHLGYLDTERSYYENIMTQYFPNEELRHYAQN